MKKGFTIVEFMVIVVIIVILGVLLLHPNTESMKQRALVALNNSGYSDPIINGRAYFKCGRDGAGFEFSAINPIKVRVSGTVCCAMSGCSVRF